MGVVQAGNGRLTFTAATRGAELQSLRTADGAEWLWQGDPAFWTGRAPILFPIVGRNADGVISIAGRTYAMGTHGFARGSEFTAVESGGDTLRLRLEDSAETHAQYPFAFRLDMVYAAEGDTLVCRAEVTNRSAGRMPCSFGFHPALRWPLPGGEGKTHFVVLAEPEEPPTTRLGDKLMTARERELSVFVRGRYQPKADDFRRDAVIIDALSGRSLRFGAEGGPAVDVGFADFPSLGIWQKPGAGYLCIEPWQGLTPEVGASNAIKDRPGIVWLEPGATRSFTMTLTPRRS